MSKFKEIAKKVSIWDCEACGAKQTVTLDSEHVHENEELGMKVVVPALVCSVCNAVGYETDSYRQILQAEEIAYGRHYVRVEIKDGQLLKHTLH